MPEAKMDFIVDINDCGMRLDKYLSNEFEDISRSYMQKLLKSDCITVNGRNVKASYQCRQGDEISVTLPELKEPEILPIDIPLDILFEDDDIIVVNKPKGMVVHPANGHYNDTLVNALMFHCKDNLSGINGVTRPGIVHRIDMNTTGVLVACKNDFSHRILAADLSVHNIKRKYECICYNRFNAESGTIDAPIGRNPSDRKKQVIDKINGRRAVTHYNVLKQFDKFSYVECELETGRTHQIRVHMASISHPLLGDDVYGPSKCPYRLTGQTLHAKILGFNHPRTKEYMEFEAPLPPYFKHLLEILDRNKND